MARINKGSVSYIKTRADAQKAIAEVTKNLQTTLNNLGAITEDQLKEIGLSIQNTSNFYAPLDTGELRDSSYVESQREGNTITVEIGYTADHAPYTHENPTTGADYVNPTTSGTHFKYLQRAVTETEADIMTILADALKNQIK